MPNFIYFKKIYKLVAIKINYENFNTNRKFISTIIDSTIVKYIQVSSKESQALSEKPNNLISCKTCEDCNTRHCPCKREGLHCNSFSHNEVPCQNHRCF
jgi:hypothetical protein